MSYALTTTRRVVLPLLLKAKQELTRMENSKLTTKQTGLYLVVVPQAQWQYSHLHYLTKLNASVQILAQIGR